MKHLLNKINLVPSSDSLDDFLTLKKIHKESMFQNVIETIGQWDEEIQHRRLKQNFDEKNKTLFFVYYDENLVGTINAYSLNDGDDVIVWIEQFYLLPKYQGLGLGTNLIEAFTTNKKSKLSFLKNDKKALHFYSKNGYKKFNEDEFMIYMEKN